ncbi:MAG: hypothetical protein J0H00_03380 [Burkholderiales bacterium]|nr:hypothetical protein [Burkholderiales bacterium]OJX05587.1 MAG: hypothetical protein BGO72_09965 [Burkholderiales bacterium 70-64]
MCGLDQLISGLGTERFCSDLLSFVGSTGTVDHAAVIRFDAQAQARVTVSATRPALRINGQHVRDAYERRFFRADPNRSARALSAGDSRAVLRRLRPGSLSDENYRFHCFELPALVDRLSVITAAREFVYCLNLYRCSCSGPFSDAEIAAVEASAPVLAALSVKHDEMARRSSAPRGRGERIADLVQRLAALRKGLTPRELEIAARIVAGMGAEAIALDLGIAPSSVVTYRRRAYARLGIAAQNELFALCYFG